MATGIAVHVAQTWGKSDSPNAMIEELKDAFPAKKAIDDIAKGPESAKRVIKGE